MSRPLELSAIISDKTISSIMHAVYFSEGPFSYAVDRIRNNPKLWPYNNARQAENEDEKKREWEGMMVQYKTKMLSWGWRLDEGPEKAMMPVWRKQRTENSSRVGLETRSEAEASVAPQKSEIRMEIVERDGGAVEEAGEMVEKGEISKQLTWMEVQQNHVEEGEKGEGVKLKPAEPAEARAVQQTVV